jgi:DNA-binding GntR family transcriptional regulator
MNRKKTDGTTNRDRAIMDIRTMILTGELKPAQRLVENTVAERLGISRTPVREAFRELVQMGLLLSESYKGVRVAEIDLTRIRQAYELRAQIEPFAAELAAERINDAQIDQLRDLNGQLGKLTLGVEKLADINDRFHLAIAEATGNQVLVEIIADLRSRTRGFRIAFHYHPALIEESVREHNAIIAALIERSRTAARTAMAQHVKMGITSTIA